MKVEASADTDTSDDDNVPLATMCNDDSDINSEQSEESDVSLHSTNLRLCDVKEDDYVLVRFITKTAEKYYIGQVMEVDEKDEELPITFMTRI